jgi:DNA/RNA-binding domain of Phe-tRNA-synthetase-like protein
VILRIGRPGESYPGIRKDVVNVADRLTLADQAGPFGNPTSDSARAMVTETTGAVLAVVFAPAATTPTELGSVLEITAQRLLQFAGGQETLRAVI